MIFCFQLDFNIQTLIGTKIFYLFSLSLRLRNYNIVEDILGGKGFWHFKQYLRDMNLNIC